MQLNKLLTCSDALYFERVTHQNMEANIGPIRLFFTEILPEYIV